MSLLEKSPMLVNAGMHPVGRLDADTSGLILFSSDGVLTQRLLHPRHEVEKEYVATVEIEGSAENIDEDLLRSKLLKGVETSEGIHTASLLRVVDSEYGDGLFDLTLTVKEGKHRMVRRMLANCGFPVVELKRERHGEILLADLDEGEFRGMQDNELDWIQSLLD